MNINEQTESDLCAAEAQADPQHTPESHEQEADEHRAQAQEADERGDHATAAQRRADEAWHRAQATRERG